MSQPLEVKTSSWLDQPVFSRFTLDWEKTLWIVILILAVFSRFYDLESRVMSHDENTHVFYSWRFYQGQGLAHDPLMHGPFQFHLIALSYFMFGDNDFTARIPAVLFSIATVGFIWFYRRYLGKTGALIGAALMLISPYMLYYGRYVRNEALVGLFGVVTLWAILRFIDTGQWRYMYILTAISVLHYTSKETSFIYSAQALLFIGFYFLFRITRLRWPKPDLRNAFLAAMILTLLLLSAFAGVKWLNERSAQDIATAQAPSDMQLLEASGLPVVDTILLGLAVAAFLAALFFLVRGYTWQSLRQDRSFSLLMVQTTLVLPQLSAFPISIMGQILGEAAWKIPTNYSQVRGLTTTDIVHIAAVVIPLFIISVIAGLLWNRREWLINAIIWYALFTIFYTSVFTHGVGFFTGLVGSLGYWLEQHPVQRGSQPFYYYALVQMPVYEYLPLLGSFLALGIAAVEALRRTLRSFSSHQPLPSQETEEDSSEEELYEEIPSAASSSRIPEPAPIETEVEQEQAPAFALLAFWSVTSLVAYSWAGEKMPWLSVHITLPMILLAAWALRRLIDGFDWRLFWQQRGWLAVLALPVFLVTFFTSLGFLLGPTPPFQGASLQELQNTSTFMTSFIALVASAVALAFATSAWPLGQLARLLTLFTFGLLSLLTARTAIQSSYINYDNANELLVYAHSAGGVKVALEQIEEISLRKTNGLDLIVAYDNETSYPYWWYLRNYPNQRYYGSDPTRSLRDAPVILVGDANFGKIESVVANNYYRFDYIRLWWPNQDYYNLTWERVQNALTDRNMRAAIFNIWLNRDYTQYGKMVNQDLSLARWSPAARMRLYIRKDIVAEMWNYGVAAAPAELQSPDPFDDSKRLQLTAELVFGEAGNLPGQFQRPRDLAIAPDGSLYIADTDNHRIQHLSPSGEVLNTWGSFGDAVSGMAPGGTFNQPWGIALAPDGSVYVADTWNHRIQKFNSEGRFLEMWGVFGQAETPTAFWGPRDVAVDIHGRVYVTDTGNKRVVVFDSNGQFLTQFGSAGLGLGQFDEPVGVTVSPDGMVFVADTWNQRIQSFTEGEDGNFNPLRSWEVVAWFGQSLDNKPYLAVDNSGNLFVTDPEGYRILWFSSLGQPRFFWGDFGTGLDLFGMPASIAIDPRGGVWVSDAGNNRIVYFSLPQP
jgi:uncharacterized protein (TIGR03663 family)